MCGAKGAAAVKGYRGHQDPSAQNDRAGGPDDSGSIVPARFENRRLSAAPRAEILLDCDPGVCSLRSLHPRLYAVVRSARWLRFLICCKFQAKKTAATRKNGRRFLFN